MTKKKDLKKRVRERQAKTGERYTAALAQVRGPQIAELPDATAEARAEGLRCTAVVSRKLREAGDLRPLFARLRSLLESLEAPACGALLRGEPSPRFIPMSRDFAEARRFVARAREGERGFSRDGRIFAFAWQGRTVMGSIFATGSRTPLLMVGLLDDATRTWPDAMLLLGIGG